VALLHAFDAMRPRLQAEELLAQIEAAQLGSGQCEQDDARRRVRALEREALGDGGREVAPQISSDALAAVGVGVRLVGADGLELADG
jgi:hypothetical protein